MRKLSASLLSELTDEPMEKIIRVFASETGYQTPKVDVRAVIFNDAEQVLLVKEKSDGGKWTLPGGWADVGFTPFEVAEKETAEETGLSVRAVRLLALLDKKKHEHPSQPWYVYKAFVLCEKTGGALLSDTPETAEASWFSRDMAQSLDLSIDRITLSQIQTMFEFLDDPAKPTLCD